MAFLTDKEKIKFCDDVLYLSDKWFPEDREHFTMTLLGFLISLSIFEGITKEEFFQWSEEYWQLSKGLNEKND